MTTATKDNSIPETNARVLCESTLSNDAFIIVNKKLAIELGTLNAVLLGELISLQKYYQLEKQLTEDGFFYRSQEDLTAATGMSIYHQQKARTELSDAGLLEEKQEGLPKKLYYRINYMHLLNYLQADSVTSKPGSVFHSGVEACSRLEKKRVTVSNNNNNKEIKKGNKEFTDENVSKKKHLVSVSGKKEINDIQTITIINIMEFNTILPLREVKSFHLLSYVIC